MTDPFVQRMMARTQARRAPLGLAENKENFSSRLKAPEKESQISSPTKVPHITITTQSEEKERPTPTFPAVSKSSPLKDVSSNNFSSAFSNESSYISETNRSSNLSSSKNRFKLLANRSQQMKEWEDDYTYHSTSVGSTKEKENGLPSLDEQKVLETEISPLACDECANNSHSPLKGVLDVDGSERNDFVDERNVDSKRFDSSPKETPKASVASRTTKPCQATPNSPRNSPSVASPLSLASVISSSVASSHRTSFNKMPPASPNLNASPTRKLKWDRNLISSLEAQGFTPTDSRSKLFFNFEKENTSKSSPHKGAAGLSQTKVSSSKEIPHVSLQSKVEINKKEETTPKVESEPPPTSSSCKVSNLRNRWEEHIRMASPERSPVRSPSPIRRQPRSTPALSNRSPSPSRKFHFGSSSTIDTPNLNIGSVQPKHFSPAKKTPVSADVIKGETPMPDVTPLVQNPSASVKERVAAFSAVSGHTETNVDPAEMSVRDRRSLFEKKNAPALVPKAPFGQNIPFSNKQSTFKSNARLISTNQREPAKIKPTFAGPSYQREACAPTSPKKALQAAEECSETEYPNSDESSYESTESVPQAPPKPPRSFFDNISPSAPSYNFSSPGSSPRSTNSFSPIKFNSTEIEAESTQVCQKKEYVPHVKPGCLFPSLSDIESHSEAVDSQSDEDPKDSSFMESVLTCSSLESLGKHIQKMAQSKASEGSYLATIEENSSKNKNLPHTTLNSTVDDLEDIDDAIEEAIEFQERPTPPKRTRPKDCEDVHYTPVQKIIRYPEICDPSGETPLSPSITIAAQIRRLEEEESRQLNLISQASGAINVSDQRPENYGSPQHIEAERLLLISTQKHLAIKDEIKRLKMDGSRALGSGYDEDVESCRGSISISKITLHLKQEFLDKFMNGDIFHHLLVLVKHRDQVITSEVVTTPECVTKGAITFPNLVSLHDLMSNFNIALEVYCVRIESPTLAQMKKKQSKLRLTPLKRLQRDARVSSPSVHSPGGPASIRTSSFALIGFAHLNINTLTSNAWTLEKVPYHSPLNGQLAMRVNCSMEGGVTIKSFLTMFEDVGGLGCWNRRWCALRGPYLRYWRYPDDENRKECLGYIDLRSCTNRTVELTSRDLCARQHTFQLTLIRPAMSNDKANLVQEVNKNAVVTRIQLSADSKEERILWCKKLTKALANVRAWDPDARRPQDFVV